jgi:hypothetical protein
MKYIPPEVGDNKIIYKGKRYWVVEFTGKDKIDGFGRDDCQFVMYDKYGNGILAYIDIKDDEFIATLAWGIDDFKRTFKNIKELVNGVIEMDKFYAKHCFG